MWLPRWTKFDDMFSRCNIIPACDRRTDILRQHSPLYAYASRDKNNRPTIPTTIMDVCHLLDVSWLLVEAKCKMQIRVSRSSKKSLLIWNELWKTLRRVIALPGCGRNDVTMAQRIRRGSTCTLDANVRQRVTSKTIADDDGLICVSSAGVFRIVLDLTLTVH